MPPPKQRTPELRARVLEVAVETLHRDGIGGFTTRKVATGASTSTKAVYELFGDKAGLVRDVFFEGFRSLGAELDRVRRTEDTRVDLTRTLFTVRSFIRDNPTLADVMFSRPFADFDPGPSELEAGAAVRESVVRRVERFLSAEGRDAEATDVAHVLLALVQGLAAQEAAGWLGSSQASIERRWRLAVDAVLDGVGRPGR